jgi:hypothetical protein
MGVVTAVFVGWSWQGWLLYQRGVASGAGYALGADQQ